MTATFGHSHRGSGSLARALALLVAVSLTAPAAPAAAGRDSSAKLAKSARPVRKPQRAGAKVALPAKAKPSHSASAAKAKRSSKPAHAFTSLATSRGGRSVGMRAATGALTEDQALAEKLRKVFDDPALRRGTTAVYVVDAHTGAPIYELHPDDPLNPASNVKLVSTATSLDVLGAEYRYRTRLLGPAPDRDGVVHGDVYLLGTWDPTLDAANIATMARDLAAAGVRRIAGDLLVGTEATRDGVYRARIGIEVAGGATPGAAPQVSVKPDNDFVHVTLKAETIKPRKVRKKSRRRVPGPAIAIAGALVTPPGGGEPHLELTISGKIGAGTAATYWRNVPERGLFTAHVLRRAMLAAGVTLDGAPRRASLEDYVDTAAEARFLPVQLAGHESMRLADIVTRINKRSINWLADRVLMTAGAALIGGPPSMEKGVEAMKRWLAQRAAIAPDQCTLDTGSGLSYRTALSPRQIVQVLRTATGLRSDAMPAADHADLERAYLGSLSIAGVDGTLRSRFRKTPMAGKVVGKTGTLSRIIALSGLLPGPAADQELAFSIVTNGHVPRHKTRVRRLHEKVVGILYEYLESRQGHTVPAAATSLPIDVSTEPAEPENVSAEDMEGADTSTDDSDSTVPLD